MPCAHAVMTRALPRCSGLVVAVRATDPVVGVPELVLGDVDRAAVRGENQVLFEHLGAEFPARRGLEPAAEAKVKESKLKPSSRMTKLLNVAVGIPENCAEVAVAVCKVARVWVAAPLGS